MANEKCVNTYRLLSFPVARNSDGTTYEGKNVPQTEFQPIYDHELYKLLRAGLPEEFTTQDGKLDVTRLSETTKLRTWTIYRWFKNENMSARSAKILAELSSNATCDRKGKITRETLTPFVLGF